MAQISGLIITLQQIWRKLARKRKPVFFPYTPVCIPHK